MLRHLNRWNHDVMPGLVPGICFAPRRRLGKSWSDRTRQMPKSAIAVCLGRWVSDHTMVYRSQPHGRLVVVFRSGIVLARPDQTEGVETMLDPGSTKAINTPNRFVESNGRTIAYRSIGQGRPLVLCVRFRGNMDSWDPAFLDALAGRGFRVITFDYSGLGLSTGTPTYSPIEMAKDPRDLVAALGLTDVIIGGWSLGGLVAQSALALYPDGINRVVLIGTNPPGPQVKPAEQLFYDIAGKEVNDAEDNVILFFEPASAASREASRQSLARIAGRKRANSLPVPIDFARDNLGTRPKPQIFPAPFVLEALKTTAVPILHIGGDHDIIFPVENWYALNQQLKTLSLITFPQSGHGPHHQFPQLSADIIASFVRNA